MNLLLKLDFLWGCCISSSSLYLLQHSHNAFEIAFTCSALFGLNTCLCVFLSESNVSRSVSDISVAHCVCVLNSTPAVGSQLIVFAWETVCSVCDLAAV